MTPKISIIIPVYKVEKYIRKTLDSVIEQIIPDVEVILVDDGSPDNCGKICDEYAEKFNFIKVIHQQNSGVSVARNRGVKETSGEYIMFLDSDDLLDDGFLKEINSRLSENADIYTFGFKFIDEARVLWIPYKIFLS